MQEGYYYDLIARNLSGVASPKEKRELADWLARSEENCIAFELQKTLWENSGLAMPESVNTDNEWDTLHSRIAEHEQSNIKIRWLPLILKFAASIVVVLAIGYFLRINFFAHDVFTVTSNNERIEFFLPDGSKVWLNKNSTLTYSKDFSKAERKVSLMGEVFFEVTKDKTRPFIITTEDAIIKVLGTSFNVRNREKEDNISVAVLTGKVAFYEGHSPDKAINISPGEMGIFNKHNDLLTLKSHQHKNVFAWQTGILKFDNEPLSEVLRQLDEHYGYTIINESKSKDCRISTTLRNEPIEKVLQELRLLVGLQYNVNGNRIIIAGANCN